MNFILCVPLFLLGILCPFVIPGHELKTEDLIQGAYPDHQNHKPLILKGKEAELLKNKSAGIGMSYVLNRCVNGGNSPEKEWGHGTKLKFIK
ncbi:MAG TPA: hypothetical protein VGF30_05425 [Bacteroidia bacterium]